MRFGTIDSDETVANVLAEVFGRNIGEDTVWWLGECPTGPNRWYAAFDGDRPVATCGMLPIIIEVDGRRCSGALCNYCGTVPEHRGKGVFTDLSRHALGDMGPDVVVEVHDVEAAPGPCMVGWRKHGVLELLGGETTRAWKEIRQYDYRDFRYYPTFKRMPANEYPRFMVVRGEAFMKWRYSKPGQTYYQNVFPDGRYAIWKSHEGRKQVMETNDWETVTNLGNGVDVWAFRGTKVSGYLRGLGFEPIFERDFVLNTELDVDRDLNRFRFELCDSDVF